MNIFIDDGASGGPVAEATSILASLVSWWEFEENDAGTTWSDSHGSNDLTCRTGGSTTATNTVTTASGKVNRSYEPGSTQDRTAYIPRSNTALDLPNSDWTIGGWVAGQNDGGIGGSSAFVMGRLGSGSGTYVAYVEAQGAAGNFKFNASADGTSFLGSADSGVSCLAGSTTDPFFIAATFDRTNNLIRIRVKRASDSKNANVTAAFGSALYTGSTAANFCFGDALSSDSTFFSGNRSLVNGKYDECFYCSKALTDAEVDYLYNAGSGIDYATLVADA